MYTVQFLNKRAKSFVIFHLLFQSAEETFFYNLQDGYYFAWDEIIFSKQAARPFSILTPIMKCSH